MTISLIFLILGCLGMVIGLIAAVIGVKKRLYLGVFLAVLSIALGIGALVNGILGLAFSYWDVEIHACAWICLGLGSGAIVVSLFALAFVKAAKKREKQASAPKSIETPDIANTIEFSGGAITVEGNKITVYQNWLPFTKFKYGRIARVIYLNDIQQIVFKGTGWFPGTMRFYFKHFNFSLTVPISKWFIWRRMAFNKKLTPFYEELLEKVNENNSK